MFRGKCAFTFSGKCVFSVYLCVVVSGKCAFTSAFNTQEQDKQVSLASSSICYSYGHGPVCVLSWMEICCVLGDQRKSHYWWSVQA